MWIYRQSTGEMTDLHGEIIASGCYSGSGDGKNNPAMQDVPCVGPLPCGVYRIGYPRDTIKHGPFALSLVPDPANQMFGRGDFMIHGDSREHPGCASEGCIIMPIDMREKVAASGDKALTVIP